jgi:hypothetical protein
MCVAVSDDWEHFVHYWLCLLQTSPGALPVLKKTTSASSVLMFPSLPEYPGPGASTSGEPAVKLPSPSLGFKSPAIRSQRAGGGASFSLDPKQPVREQLFDT